MANSGMRSMESHRAWRTSSFCDASSCAEVSEEDGEILLRSTRAPGVVVRLTGAEWQAFTKGVAAGEFSDLSQGQATQP
jgi:Domain of unknown function (DUF397)